MFYEKTSGVNLNALKVASFIDATSAINKTTKQWLLENKTAYETR